MLTEARWRAAKPGQRPDGSAKRAMPLDESGLYLQVDQGADDSVSKSWLYRYSIAGKCRAIGLGSYPQVSLADARNAAAIQRAIWASGRDPLLEKRAARAELLVQIAAEAAPKPASKTFSQCAEAYIEEHKPGWKNPKSEAAWRGTLKGYAFPVIGCSSSAIGSCLLTTTKVDAPRSDGLAGPSIAIRPAAQVRYGRADPITMRFAVCDTDAAIFSPR
jgi:hypothetical protein